MAPPKKDAFSDLFNYAQGSSSRSSPSSSLNDLSSKNSAIPGHKTPTNNWANLDILSPTSVLSPNGSKPPTPVNASGRANGSPSKSAADLAAESDPFAIFETQVGGPQKPAPPAASDPFDFFDANSLPAASSSRKQKSNPASADDLSVPRLPNRPRNEPALLDDEFTDAFAETPQNETQIQDAPEPSAIGQNKTKIDERDHVLAELMAEGFPIELANRAIAKVGPDFEKCTRLIVMSSVRPENETQASAPKDLGGALQDMSTDLYKKASWFLDKSRKTVIKNINNLQNQRARRDANDLPAWISNQHKYKDQAVERKKDGGSYEDYGTDEENINAEEIRRLVQAQRQKEVERQRQRLESMGKNGSKSGSKSGSRNGSSTSIDTPNWTQRASPETSPDKARIREPSAPDAAEISQGKITQVPERTHIGNTEPEVDLLGLNSDKPLSRAQRFKQSVGEESSYVSPSRRRQPASTSSQNAQNAQKRPDSPRPATSEPLNTFAQSDYDTHKAKGAESFSSGDYDNALISYTKCLKSLPEKHELRIVISANLALTAIKIGNYRLASQNCEEGLALVGTHSAESEWCINEKNIKYWYVRLLARKAESLEMLENFRESLDCYMDLVKLGVNDKKTMDAKRRVNNIVNPPKEAPKSAAKSSSKSGSQSLPKTASKAPVSKNLDQVKNHHMKEKLQEQQKFQLHDVVHERIQKWSHGKEDNLRSLLMSLSDVLPQRLGFPFITEKKITINDLMLTKKVKVNYMKVISNIHPDKLGGYQLEDQMICQGVFVALNKAWDAFKVQNNIA